MTITKIKLPVLQAMLAFTSTDETRYVLNGVLIECRKGGGVRMVATDGRRLLAHEPEWETDRSEPVSFIFPSSVLRAVALKDYHRDIRMEFHPATQQISMVFGMAGYEEFTLSCKAIDGTYPSWQQIVPNPLPTEFPAKRMALNRHFFGELIEAIDALDGKDNSVTFSAVDDGGPLVAKTLRSTALLMPLRIN